MKRLLFMLGWSECRRASWLLASGDQLEVVRAFDRAVRYLKASAESDEGREGWRPIAPARRGGRAAEPRH